MSALKYILWYLLILSAEIIAYYSEIPGLFLSPSTYITIFTQLQLSPLEYCIFSNPWSIKYLRIVNYCFY